MPDTGQVRSSRWTPLAEPVLEASRLGAWSPYPDRLPPASPIARAFSRRPRRSRGRPRSGRRRAGPPPVRPQRRATIGDQLALVGGPGLDRPAVDHDAGRHRRPSPANSRPSGTSSSLPRRRVARRHVLDRELDSVPSRAARRAAAGRGSSTRSSNRSARVVIAGTGGQASGPRRPRPWRSRRRAAPRSARPAACATAQRPYGMPSPAPERRAPPRRAGTTVPLR